MKTTTPKINETFAEWFDRQGFKNFSASEFTSYFGVYRRGVHNAEPPRELWENIVPTLRIVDRVRDHYGRSVVLTSSYRSRAYNTAIGAGAATKSQHLRFAALDIVVAGVSPRDVFNLLVKWRDEGKFKGGLGKYNNFTHIDTRGSNATW